ncbi:hypothetical protein LMG27174_07340 [Paraburkholderia rhynchosiae]|uniref:Secreted protein n=1 Tax=Paraburkholderia rhynchosiae TaxID=487049 RepID=A0A6J5CXM9_9BURK|nr:hypothetical protein LMG27174_07340 [Paraburkholderia rhynchosiae]
MRTFTPRFAASTIALIVSLSGTKYALDKWMECVAAVIAMRYINCMSSLPPEGELLNMWARPSPAASISGKYCGPCSTFPVALIQLSMKTACICPTAGPSTRKCVSRQCFSSCACPAHSSAIPTPPVKPMRPSITSSLRCVRSFMRPRPVQCGL